MTTGWQVFEHTATAQAGKPALLMGDVTVSFAALAARVRGFAAGLVAHGVAAGDRVVLHLANGPEAAALPAALWALGAVPVLAPSDLRAEALAGVVARVGARGVVSDRLVDCSAPVWRAEALDGVFGGAAAGDGAGSVVFTLGAELHAFVVGGEVRAVEAACRAGLAAHERPRKLHIVRALPLTASGKVDLVALAAAGGSHAWEG